MLKGRVVKKAWIVVAAAAVWYAGYLTGALSVAARAGRIHARGELLLCAEMHGLATGSDFWCGSRQLSSTERLGKLAQRAEL